MKTIAKTEKLSVAEAMRYARHQKTIRKNSRGVMEYFLAIEDIRDHRLYREEYSTFEEYCNKELELTRQWVNRLIAKKKSATRAVVAPSPADEPPPTAAKPPKDEEVKVIEVAEVILDDTGCEIPEDLVPLWNRRNEITEHLSALSDLKCAVAKALKDEDPLYFEINNSLVSMLQNCYGTMQLAKPFAVCTSCNGRNKDKCALCKGRGLLSKYRYEGPAIPQSIRDMRKRMAGKK